MGLYIQLAQNSILKKKEKIVLIFSFQSPVDGSYYVFSIACVRVCPAVATCIIGIISIIIALNVSKNVEMTAIVPYDTIIF